MAEPDAQFDADPREAALLDDPADSDTAPNSQSAGNTSPKTSGGSGGGASGGPPWRDVWHIPVLLLGIGLFILGLRAVLPEEKTYDVAAALRDVNLLLEAGNLDEARARVDELAGHVNQAPVEQLAEYHVLNGDLIYLEQRELNSDLPVNHEAILSLYSQAAQLGWSFDSTRQRRWIQTLVALGRSDEALAMLSALPADQSAIRHRIVREIIERRLSARSIPSLADLEPLITRYQQELLNEAADAVRRDGEIWITNLKGRLLLAENDTNGAVRYLSLKYARLQRADDADLAPTRVLLARAYQHLGQLAEAQRWYLLAQRDATRTIDGHLNAAILVGLGQIELAQADSSEAQAVSRALNYFEQAEREYPGTEAYIDALIGLGDCHGRLGNHAEARAAFTKAVAHLTEDDRRPDPAAADRLTQTVVAHRGLAGDREDHELALAFLQTLNPLYRDELPADLLAMFAVTHRRIAEQRTASARAALDAAGLDPGEAAAAQRAARIDAAVHFEKAGDFYHQYARAATIPDAVGRADTLWTAAQMYDLARRWDRSINVYNEFYETTESDPRRRDAQYRLGLAYMAGEDYPAALGLFKSLVEQSPNSPQAYAAHVPLARVYQAMDRAGEAEHILRVVVTNHPSITPESEHYREALIELGELYYKQGDHEQAIVYLDQAVNRYSGEPRLGSRLKYRLADAYRKNATQIEATLEEPMPDSRRAALHAQHADWLSRAQILFSQVIDEKKQRGEHDLSTLEQVYYRNAWFYRADCAYDLGRFEEAIHLYDQAAKTWEKHPSSLVAIVQIVNANCELGRIQQARIANDKARHFLKRIPEEAFNDPTLPMSRKQWEDWLRWSSELNLFSPRAAGE